MSLRTNTAEQAARITAADPGVSAWVSANAGTGKTTVLVNRIIRLLLAGTPPSRILCLTFTRAAAAEMAARLNEDLGKWAVMDEADLRAELTALLGADPGQDLSRARHLFAESLEVPGGLKVQTIHAFCESLLARFPIEAGVSPHFSVMDERTAAELLRNVRDRVLAREDLAYDLQHMAELVDEDQFTDVMRELQANRGKLRRLLSRHGGRPKLMSAVRQVLGVGEGDTPDSVIEQACAPGAFDETNLRAVCRALSQGSPKDTERGTALAAWLDAGPERRAAGFETYMHLFLTQKREPTITIITKKAAEIDPGAEESLRVEQIRVYGVSERFKAATVAHATSALVTVGEALLAAYEAAKEARALFDYDDLILKAHDLLKAQGGVNWVLYKLDGGLDHILVDEAQDTSPDQWEILDALGLEFFSGESAGALHRTVFGVGDEKQSIYSFQGADPAGFGHQRDTFATWAQAAGKPFAPVEMALSFRSTWSVLGLVDKVFATETASVGLTFGDRPVRHLSNRDGQAGLVEMWETEIPIEEEEQDPWDAPLDQVPAHSPPTRLAGRVADTVKGWIDRKEILESRDRPIVPGDIMILVRTRTHFVETMVRELKKRGIPVAGTDRMILTDQLVVMDMMALGRFALLADDDLNTATVLKGPLAGLDDEDLFRLAHKRTGTVWQALGAAAGDDARLAEVHRRLSDLRRRADFAPPFEFFAYLLGPLGGRTKLLARLGPDAGDPIDEFLALALAFERDHVPSLQGFLHWLEAGRAEVKRDLEQGQDQVRVMTVHGAKGLQAPVVVLPDTCTLPPANKDPRLRWRLDGDLPVLLWPVRRENEGSLSRELREEARRRQEEEYRRLLYVAMTRAEDRLYITGWEGKRGRDDDCWYNLVAAALRKEETAFPGNAGETVWRLTLPQETEPDRARTADGAAAPAVPLPAWTRRPVPAEPKPPQPLAPSRPASDEPPVSSPLSPGDEGHFQRGRLIHRLLQTLPDLLPERRRDSARAFLARPACGLEGAHQEAVADEVLEVLDDPRFAVLFGPGSRAEVPLVGLVGGMALSARVDRLVVMPSAILVVDYKTNRSPPDKAKNVPAPYLVQMAAYRAALQAIYPDRSVRAALLWTDGPTLMELPDVLLDRHAP